MIAIDALLLPERQEGHVAEIQGAEGAYSFSELILQKIWLRRDFDGAQAITSDGRKLTVLNQGRWNRGAGPDFRCARLRLGDRELAGDVEVHLNAMDWEAHGHASDPEYDQVVLHVVLFPPAAGQRTLGSKGREIPMLSLLSLLPRDIESFALDDAAEHLAGRPAVRLFDSLSSMSAESIRDMLEGHAHRRWEEKLHFARFRIERLGWEEACHHAALECLGYSGNRAQMLKVAGRWPLDDWRAECVSAQQAWEETQKNWRLRCGRPANHPLHRLKQYAEWVRAVPDWPARLGSLEFSTGSSVEFQGTREARRTLKLSDLRKQLVVRIVAGKVGGPRFDTLACDAFLPLLAVRGAVNLSDPWFHWWLGDAPDSIRAALRDAARVNPQHFCHSNGLAQGLLAWSNAQLMRK